MELTNEDNFDGVHIYIRPTIEERQALRTGKGILLKHYVGTAPLCVAGYPPTHGELQGFVDGIVAEKSQVDYPKGPLSGSLANSVYFNRIETAALQMVEQLKER